MSKADDILKKYGISQVRNSETGGSKGDEILNKYGITQVRNAETDESVRESIKKRLKELEEEEESRLNVGIPTDSVLSMGAPLRSGAVGSNLGTAMRNSAGTIAQNILAPLRSDIAPVRSDIAPVNLTQQQKQQQGAVQAWVSQTGAKVNPWMIANANANYAQDQLTKTEEAYDAFLQANQNSSTPPVNLPEAVKLQEKAAGLDSEVAYWENQRDLNEDQTVTQKNLDEISSWSAEEQAAMDAYVNAKIARDSSSNILRYFEQQKIVEKNGKLLEDKVGAERLKELAQSYERKLSAQATQQIKELGENHATGFIGKTAASAATVGTSLIGNVTAPIGYLSEMMEGTGQYKTLDPNNIGNLPNVYSGAIRGKVAGDLEQKGALGKVGSVAYQGGMSALDSFTRLAVAGEAGSLVLAGMGSFGQTVSDASAKGASPEQAIAMGVIDAGLEVITEEKSLGNLLDQSAAGYQGALKAVKDAFVQAGVEISEEELSFIGSTMAEAAILREKSSYNQQIGELVAKGMSYEDAKKQADRALIDEALQTAAVSGFSGGLMSGAASVVNKVSASQNNQTTLTENEQKVVDKVTNDRIAEQEQDGEKLTDKAKKQIREAVIREMEDGSIPTDTIEEVLGSESRNTYRSLKEESDEFNTLYNTPFEKRSERQNDRLKELKAKNEAKSYEEALKEAKQNSFQDSWNAVKGTRLAESYNEKARRGQAFEADLSKYDAKQQKVIQKAIDSGILNNTNRTHKFVDWIARVSADKDILFDFTNNKKLKESGFALDGKTVNGYVTKDGVTININSAKALNSVVGHEITHVVKGTKFYAELQKTLFDYAKNKGDYQGRLDSITKLYEGVEGADIEEELTADLVGDYLFTDADFVNRLSTENRNVFQKIYDEIKYLCKVVTAGSKEAKQLEKAKKIFEDAFRAEAKNTVTEDGVRYSLGQQSATNTQSQYAYMKPFADQLADYQKGNINVDDALVVGATPDVLKEIGLVSLPMTINQKHVGDALNGTYKGTQQEKLDHTFTAKELATLPEKLADPVAIIYDKRTGKASASESNIDVLVEMTVASGKQVLAAVQINGSGHINGIRIDSNKVATVHGNTDSVARLIDAINENQKGNVAVFYLNNDKTTKVLQSTGNPIPSGLSNLDGFIHSITDPGSPVKMRISSVTESQQFKRWFGDWQNHPENASKVVNADGTPKLMYHGSNEQFTVFDKSKAKSSGHYGRGFYFTDSESQAGVYGNQYCVYLNVKHPLQYGTETVSREQVRSFLEAVAENEDYSIENYGTYDVDAILNTVMGRGKSIDAFQVIQDINATAIGDMVEAAELFNSITGTEFDGIIVPTETVVFRPEQIKSATDNIGTFDGGNPDIRYSLSNDGEQIAPYGNWNVSGKDIALDIAPVGENVAVQEKTQLTEDNSTGLFPDDFPIRGDVRPMEVPKTDAYGRRVSEFAANAYGAEVTPDAMASRIEELVADGALGFDTRTNKQSLENAAAEIQKRGMYKTEKQITLAVANGKIRDGDIEKAMLLYASYANQNSQSAQDKAAELMVDLATMANMTGRNLQLFKMLRRLTPDGQLMTVQKNVERYVDQLNTRRGKNHQAEVNIPQEMMDQYREAAQADIQEQSAETARAKEEAEQAIYKVAAAQIKATPMEKLNAWRYMAMLGNVKTQVRNVAGNAAFRPYVATKRAIGAVMEQMFVEQGSRTKSILGFGKNARALRAWAAQDAKSADTEKLFDYSARTGDASRGQIEENRAIYDTRALEATRKFIQAVPEGADMIFKRAEYTTSLASFLKARGYTAADLEAGNVADDVLNEARSYAAQEALKATFNDQNAVSDFVSKRYKGNNAFGKAMNLLAEGVMPFRRTPANILVRAAEYSPANIGRSMYNFATKVRSGEMTASTAIDQMAAGLTGTGAMVLGYAMASGVFGFKLVGHLDDEDEKNAGHQAYALEIGGKSYSLAWAAPANIPLFVGANIYDAMKNRDPDTGWFVNAVDASVNSLEPMLELSCLSSLNDLVESARYAEDGTGIYTVVAQGATSYLNQFIPTLFGQIEQAVEGEKKQVYSDADTTLERSMEKTIGRATQKIPGVDLYQTRKFDNWGRPVETSNPFDAFLSPSYSSEISTDPVDAEIQRLNGAQDQNVSIDKPAQTVTYTDTDGTLHKNERLTAQQWETVQQVYGQTAKQILDGVIDSKDYKALSDSQKAEVFSLVYDYAREKSRAAAVEDYAGTGESWMEGIEGKEGAAIIRKVAAAGISGAFDGLVNDWKAGGDGADATKKLDEAYGVYSGLSLDAQTKIRNEASGRMEAFLTAKQAGVDTGTFTDLYKAYYDINGSNVKAAAKANNWAYELQRAKERGEITNTQMKVLKRELTISSDFTVEAEKFDALTESGLSAEKADYITDLLSRIKPQAGYSDVRNIQKAEKIAGVFSLTESEKVATMKIYLSYAQNENLDEMRDLGYSTKDYVKAWQIYDSESGQGKKQRTIARYQKEFGISYVAAKEMYEIYG